LPDRVLVVHLTASKPKSISFTASFSTPQPKTVVKTSTAGEIIITGTTTDHEGGEGKVRFEGITHIKPEGGTLTANDTAVVVNQANAVTNYVNIATNFNNYSDISGNEHDRSRAQLNAAFSKSFDRILKDHVKAYQKYFNRVKLDLGVTDAAKLPTDER